MSDDGPSDLRGNLIGTVADAKWNEWYELYLSWPLQTGGVVEAIRPSGVRLVPTAHVTADGLRLGKWQENQRQAYKLGRLTAERIRRLEAAGMVWDLQDFLWEEGYAHFISYPPSAEGTRNVPITLTMADGFRLGAWQHTQRALKKAGKLTKARASRLGEAGIIWDLQVKRRAVSPICGARRHSVFSHMSADSLFLTGRGMGREAQGVQEVPKGEGHGQTTRPHRVW